MTSYNNVFGNNQIQPSNVSYATYTLTSSVPLALNWPTSFLDTNDPVSGIIDVYGNVVNSTIQLPNATLVSVGTSFQINSLGTNTVFVDTYLAGGPGLVVAIPTGVSYEVYLVDNTTTYGTWHLIQSGAVPSTPQASAIAGNGTVAIAGLLNTNVPGTTIGVNYQVLLSDRATLNVWTGGAGIITLLNPLVDGFYVSFNNQGSGQVTFNTGDGTTINGESTFVMAQDQSSMFIANSGQWYTLGYGQNTQFQATALTYNVAAGGTFNLTATQAGNLIITFTGALAANALVNFPATTGQWYINNATSNAYTLTIGLTGLGGSQIVLPQGQRFVVYSDGSNMYTTPTVEINSLFGDGTQASPGIAFASEPSMGFYKFSATQTGFAVGNTTPVILQNGGGYAILIRDGLSQAFYNSGNSNYISLSPPAGLSRSQIYNFPLVDGTGTQCLLTDGNNTQNANLSWSTGGVFVQQKGVTTAANLSGNGIINPYSTPTTAEGNEFLQVDITPKNAANILIIEVNAILSNSSSSSMMGALFTNLSANAIAATITSIPATIPNTVSLTMFKVINANVTTPLTFSFYAGGVSGTTYLNADYVGTTYFNGHAASSMIIREYSQ